MSENDYEASAAHDSSEVPLEHIGDPVKDPLLSGAMEPGSFPEQPVQAAGPESGA